MAARVPRHYPKQRETTINSKLYLSKAKEYAIQRNLTKAYEYFVKYFETLDVPSNASSNVQVAFTKIICEMGAVLEETHNVEELLKCYLQAINFFPDNYVILNNLGGYMFKVGQLEIARRYLESAVKANKDYLPAEKNLMHVKWFQIPRWHFRMLNDKQRNQSYAKAINQVIEEGYTNVVDIGTGCGLLTLIAAQNPNANVTAIEENKTLFKMCAEILKENNVKNVRLLHCNSNEFTTAPAPCNLIVTEIFDDALFGERALESLTHALKTLVTYPKFKTIPARADVFVTGISNRYLVSRYRVINDLKVLNLDHICIRQSREESYDAEYLINKQIKIKWMTDTNVVFKINFSDFDQLNSLINDENACQYVDLKCVEDGWLHTFAVWFDLYLTEDIKITTNPKSEDCLTCWEQAIFHITHPLFVVKDDIIRLKATINDGQLLFQVVNKQDDCHCFEVSNEIVTFLNDDLLVDTIIKVADEYSDPSLKIVDLSFFPLFGFLMAKKGCRVYHVYKESMDFNLFMMIMKKNDIDPANMTFIEEKNAMQELPHPCNLDIVYTDPVNSDGSLNKTLTPIDFSKHSNVVILPQATFVRVQLAHSCYIDFCNKLKDENALNFNIAKHINEYTGTEHPNLTYNNPSPLSAVITLRNDGSYYERQIQVPVKEKGLLNAIYYWYEIKFTDELSFSTSRSTFYKKSCAIVENPIPVDKGSSVKVTIKREDNYLKVSC